MWSTRTVLRKGCTQHRHIAILPEFSRDPHERSYENLALSATKSQFYHSFACRHARSYERVALTSSRSQFYHSFVRSTRTILRKGCTDQIQIAILPQFRAIDTHDLTNGCTDQIQSAILLQFRAIDTHDLTKWLIGHRQDRHFTTVSRDRCERVAFPQAFSGPWHPPLILLKYSIK